MQIWDSCVTCRQNEHSILRIGKVGVDVSVYIYCILLMSHCMMLNIEIIVWFAESGLIIVALMCSCITITTAS